MISLNQPEPEPHIIPLWLSKEESLQIFLEDYEVETVLSCNILPLYKTKVLFGENIWLRPPTVHLRSYSDSAVQNLGSYIVFLYHDSDKYGAMCKVARQQMLNDLTEKSLRIKYVYFPKICKPTINIKSERTHQSRPYRTFKSISQQAAVLISMGKTHSLSTTKEYLLIEYADVFQGIGSLSCEDYHIQLKKDYKPVQCPL